MRIRIGLALLFVAVIPFAPSSLPAQAHPGIRLEAIEEWIRGGLALSRIRDKYIAKEGIAFVMDAASERRLRSVGASNEWIAMLRAAHVTIDPTPRAETQTATVTNTKASTTEPLMPSPPPHLSRDELAPLYYAHDGAVEIYVSSATLTETGGAVKGESMRAGNETIPLESVPLRRRALAYGLVVGTPNLGLEFEGYFQSNLMMIHAGMAMNPFLPVGTTGVRVILGATPFIGDTRQIIGHLSRAPGDTSYNAIELHNAVLGADLRAGLAYHWGPSSWISVYGRYRAEFTAVRQLEVPGQQTITEGITWSKWGARGPMLTIGIGF